MSLRPLVALLAALLSSLASSAGADPRGAVEAYRAHLAAVENAAAPVSMEGLFEAAQAVQDALMQLEPDGRQAWIETLPEADYAALREQLRGLRLSRGLDVYAQPEPAFLAALAQRKGLAADRAFFERYRRSWNADGVPDYLRLVPGRVAPCVRFGEDVIGELYEAWRDFRDRHPQDYAGFSRQWVRDLEEVVELGTCACADRASVEQELRGFVNRFPNTPARPAILARLRQLEDDPDRRPVHCR